MSTTDQIHRFIFDNTDIRGKILCLDQSFYEAHSHQQLPSALWPLFGQFLVSATLMAEILKFEGFLTLQARGSGDIALIMAEADHLGQVRGIIKLTEDSDSKASQSNWQKSLPELLGPKATLAITIDPEKGKRYQGIVPLDAPDLATCLEHYFAQSEQLPTKLWLFADAARCGGLFLQCLPAQQIKSLEQRNDLWETAVKLGSTITERELFDLAHEELLYRLFNEFDCRLFTPKNIRFHCSCTRERSARALTAIGRESAYRLLRERDIINMDCQFCGKGYAFGEKDLDSLFPSQGQYH